MTKSTVLKAIRGSIEKEQTQVLSRDNGQTTLIPKNPEQNLEVNINGEEVTAFGIQLMAKNEVLQITDREGKSATWLTKGIQKIAIGLQSLFD